MDDAPEMMRLTGVPLASLTEAQLADYAAMLITDQGNVPWGHAIIGLLTWRYWKRPDPMPLTILQRLIRTLFQPFTRGVPSSGITPRRYVDPNRCCGYSVVDRPKPWYVAPPSAGE